MQVQVESLSAARRQVKVQIPAGSVSRVWTQVVRRIGARVRIPGFRPGKAPKRMLERRYGAAIREEVLDKVLPKAITEALDQANLQPLGRPEIEDIGEVNDDTVLDITFSCDVMPTLQLDGYIGADYTIDRVQADEADIDAEVETRRQRATEVVDVDDAAITDDVVRLRFTLTAVGGAAPVVDAPETELQERRVPVGGSVKWLSDIVEGSAAGHGLQVEVDVPEHEGTDFDGQTALLTGEIVAVQRRVVPELDDALAVKLGYADLAALRAAAKTACDLRAEQRSHSLRRSAVLEHILANHEIDAPSALVNHEIDNSLQRMFGGMNLNENPALSRYLDELRGGMRPEAEAGVKQALVLSHLAAEHDLEVTDADIDARIEKMVAERPDIEARVRESLGTDEARSHLRAQISEDKVLEMILSKSNVTEGAVLSLATPDPEPESADEAAESVEASGAAATATADAPSADADEATADATAAEADADADAATAGADAE